MQQHEQPLVRAQDGEQPDLIAQRTADDPHPHARREPVRPRQLDKTATFARADLVDD
jgi:hypothetical protein